jgi:hypothetical protein
MEQRRLRLGDIVDDYCPRERRVTNHAVVAMIEEEIKQTRCTTCDADHPYKGGQAPRRRKKESPSLYKEVLAGKPAGKNDDAPHLTPAAPASVARAADAESDATTDEDFSEDSIDPVEVTAEPPDSLAAPEFAAEPPAHEQLEADASDGDIEDGGPPSGDLEDGPVHRPLIRATLPRPEGQKDVRNPPDFTIRQAGGRGQSGGNQQFRGGGGNARARMRGNPQSNGHRTQGGHGRFAGARPGQGGQARGQGGNFRSAQQPRHGGNRKRSR